MAKIEYPTPQVVRAAQSATEVRCRGIQYRFAPGEPSTVTFYFEAVDSGGTVVARDPVTVPLTAQDVDKLQREAFKEVARAYPSGPVV